METCPIIFLDIDGVLNCQEFYTRTRGANMAPDLASTYPLCEFDPVRIELLNDLCKETEAKIVISSSWRHGRDISEMRNIFNELKCTAEIIDYTPNLRGEHYLRGNEIYAWVNEHSEELYGVFGSNFTNYVIIDDDSDMLLWQKDHFFQTDTWSGLTPNICYKIKRFLNSTKNITI